MLIMASAASRGRTVQLPAGGGGDVPAGAISMRVDESPIYQINPSALEVHVRDIWAQYPYGEIGHANHEDNGTITFNTTDYVTGSQSLQLSMQPSPDGHNGAPYLQFYPNSEQVGRWIYLREALNEAYGETGWQLNTYNRLRFNVKTPSTITAQTDGTHNLTIGTYYSSVAAGGPTSGSAENGGNHFYHRFNMRPSVWNQCVMDTHPHHVRGANGGTEHGDKYYPDADDQPTYNYFDLMTRMYWDIEESDISASDVWLFDDFYIYEEARTEEEDAIYALCGSYDSGSNMLTVDWSRDKDANGTNFDVRYAFTDIHTLGWDNAIAAPSGSNIAPAGFGGYNGAYYTTTAIDVSGQTEIYFAVRRLGDTLFKQIRLDLTL